MEYLRTGTPELGPEYLKPSEFFNFDQAVVRDFAEGVVEGTETPVEQAVKLYYAVRDSIRYDPYRISLDRELFQASHLLGAGAGFCLPKANLLIASARAVGIAAAIGLSDVANHLCTERLRRLMGGKELFLHHGYAVPSSRWRLGQGGACLQHRIMREIRSARDRVRRPGRRPFPALRRQGPAPHGIRRRSRHLVRFSL